jgi:hypothetical protein
MKHHTEEPKIHGPDEFPDRDTDTDNTKIKRRRKNPEITNPEITNPEITNPDDNIYGPFDNNENIIPTANEDVNINPQNVNINPQNVNINPQDVNIDPILDNIPPNYKEDPIKDTTFKTLFNKNSEEPTMFDEFQNIITATEKKYEQVKKDGLEFINNQFKAVLKDKTINEKTEIKDLLATKTPTPYELLRMTQALAYVQILKLTEDPKKDANNMINDKMSRIYQLKIFLIEHQDSYQTVYDMFNSVRYDEFLGHFNYLVGLINDERDTIIKTGTQPLIESIFDTDEIFGRIGDDNDEVNKKTKVRRTKIILAHAFFPKHVSKQELRSKLMEHYDEKIYQSLINPVNIPQLDTDSRGSPSKKLDKVLEHLINLKVYYLAIANAIVNGVTNIPTNNFFDDYTKVPSIFKGGKSRKTRKIKKTKRTNKKNKRNTKKGRKMRKTRKK